MGLDLDNLGAAPDLETIDFTKLDMGNDLEPKPTDAEADAAAKAAAEAQAEADAAAAGLKPDEKGEGEDEGEEGEKAEAKDEAGEKKDEPARDDQGKFAKKDKPIPVERHKAILDKERDARELAEKRAAELERQLYQRGQDERTSVTRNEKLTELDTQISALEKQHSKLLLDGEADKAAEKMAEIRQLNRAVARIEAQEESTQIVSRTLERERLDVTIARLEADYPVLNPKSETYDDDLVETILALQNAKVQKGVPPSQALAEAAQKIMDKLKPTEAPPAEDTGLAKAKGKEQAEERTKEAVKKSLEAQKQQPASLHATGLDSDKAGEKALPDVSKMSDEEYAALPEATRARLRGDMV